MTAPDRSAEPADDLRDRIAASVRHHIDHEIIAEWICCDPVNPSHHLCWWGEGVRQTMRSLLADNDDEYPSKVIDGVTADLQPSQLPASPTAGSNDLRQQLADAISSKAHICYIECECDGDHPILATTSAGDAESGPVVLAVEGSPEAIADVCAAEVQPALDTKDAEIKRLNALRDELLGDIANGVQVAAGWRNRAQAAEAVANNISAKAGLLRLDLATAIKRAEDAEAERRDWQMAAQTAENELARLREQHQQIGDLP